MGLSGFISSQLKTLNQPLAANSAAHPDDVFGVKIRLHEDGYYDMPSYGLSDIPDSDMFSGIKNFQRDNGLTIDGIMNPDVETENAMRFPIMLASNYPLPDVIAPKKEFFKDNTALEKGRENFGKALNKLDLSKRGYNTIMTTYEMEGGDKADGHTVSGITVPTLKMLNKKYNLGIAGTAQPSTLTHDDKANALYRYGDYSFERVGGFGFIDKLPSDRTASALYDTMVRHGPEGGSLMVRKALNATATRDQVPLDLGTGRIGPTTLERLQSTLKEPQKAKNFYDALANERTKQYPNETTRFDYLRLNQ